MSDTESKHATGIGDEKQIDFSAYIPSEIPTTPDSFSTVTLLPESSQNKHVSISTTFFPNAQNHSSRSDVILFSSDYVFFYVHSEVLLTASQNLFNSLLSVETVNKDNEVIVAVSDSAEVLNVVLHAIYNISCSNYAPTVATVSAGISALKTYGVNVNFCICPSNPLFTLLLSHAPAAPLEVYTIAAEHALHDLAVLTSPRLLSFNLSTLSDDVVQKIGPVYLKRLFFLHLGRTDALKRLLLPPPHPHAPNTVCDFVEQKKLTRAWALATASLAWETRPDMSERTLEAALVPLGDSIWCEQCREALQERIRTLIMQWSSIKDHMNIHALRKRAQQTAPAGA